MASMKYRQSITRTPKTGSSLLYNNNRDEVRNESLNSSK